MARRAKSACVLLGVTMSTMSTSSMRASTSVTSSKPYSSAISAAHEQLLDPLRAALPGHLGLPFQVPVAEARLGAEAAAHGAVVHAFQRHAAEIYGIEDMPAPPITPLPHEPATADHAEGDDTEEKK